jgi:hypothetical protein
LTLKAIDVTAMGEGHPNFPQPTNLDPPVAAHVVAARQNDLFFLVLLTTWKE